MPFFCSAPFKFDLPSSLLISQCWEECSTHTLQPIQLFLKWMILGISLHHDKQLIIRTDMLYNRNGNFFSLFPTYHFFIVDKNTSCFHLYNSSCGACDDNFIPHF